MSVAVRLGDPRRRAKAERRPSCVAPFASPPGEWCVFSHEPPFSVGARAPSKRREDQGHMSCSMGGHDACPRFLPGARCSPHGDRGRAGLRRVDGAGRVPADRAAGRPRRDPAAHHAVDQPALPLGGGPRGHRPARAGGSRARRQLRRLVRGARGGDRAAHLLPQGREPGLPRHGAVHRRAVRRRRHRGPRRERPRAGEPPPPRRRLGHHLGQRARSHHDPDAPSRARQPRRGPALRRPLRRATHRRRDVHDPRRAPRRVAHAPAHPHRGQRRGPPGEHLAPRHRRGRPPGQRPDHHPGVRARLVRGHPDVELRGRSASPRSRSPRPPCSRRRPTTASWTPPPSTRARRRSTPSSPPTSSAPPPTPSSPRTPPRAS